MNFLVVFDPVTGVSQITPYPDEAIDLAMRDRLKAEIDVLERGEPREVVVLNARSLDDLRETHARYFGDAALRSELKKLLGDPPAA